MTGKRLLDGWAFLVYVFLYAPIGVVVLYAFNENRQVQLWTGFSTAWFRRALEDDDYVAAVVTSLEISLVASLIAVVLGTLAALALARMRRSLRVPFDVLAYLTLVVPEIVIAVGTLIFFVQVRAADPTGVFPALGWPTITIAHGVFASSVVMLIVRARFVGMGSQLEEASFDLGAGPLATFRQVTLPRLAPAILAGFLLAFVFSFDDYVLSVFTAGTTETWPITIYNAVRFGVSPKVNALATIMLAITLIAITLAAVVLRRSRADGDRGGLHGLGL